jgi:tRNA A-37 threonylcarbamoyl transferase component Bud32
MSTDAPESLRAGRYRVVRVLGEGGQATTFEAVDARTKRAVAVKRFRIRGAKSWKEVELAEREARVLASLEHPSIPRYVDHFEEGGDLFLVTEKIEGESLASLRKRGVAFGERDVVRLLRDADAALAYLHGRAPPIIHRDLKPSNVIRRPDGSYSFIDFGAVRDKMKPEGGSTVVGTFGYMAPEQFQGRAMPASDVYAIGATALALLTGREPEDLPHKGLALDVAAALSGRSTSPALVRALVAMLEPDPDKRATSLGPLVASLAAPLDPPRDERAPRPREARREARALARQAKRDARDARREARHRARGGFLPGIILALVVLGLSLAELGVIVALRVVIPAILSILSVVFGKGMRTAAGFMSEVGKNVAEALARARRNVRGAEPEIRVRVADPDDRRRLEAPGDEEAEREADAVDEASAEERRAKRG